MQTIQIIPRLFVRIVFAIIICSSNCKDNVKWLNKRRSTGDKSVQYSTYIGWNWEAFEEGNGMALEYSGGSEQYPSEPFYDKHTLVDKATLGLLGQTFGPVYGGKKGVLNNKYVIYAALDLMALEFHKQNPDVDVGLRREWSFLVDICDRAGGEGTGRR